jgi:hypothetical protein
MDACLDMVFWHCLLMQWTATPSNRQLNTIALHLDVLA